MLTLINTGLFAWEIFVYFLETSGKITKKFPKISLLTTLDKDAQNSFQVNHLPH